jgi:hypothetical protein
VPAGTRGNNGMVVGARGATGTGRPDREYYGGYILMGNTMAAIWRYDGYVAMVGTGRARW